jgi:hypothetical protein
MARLAALLLTAVGTAAALSPTSAQQPPALAQAQPGLWEVTGIPGHSTPIRQCVADLTTLARFEHRAANCSARVLKSAGTHTAVEYSCGAAGFGHSEIELITPRSLRISTQGISGGLPFNYVLQARRVADCTKSASVMRH